MDKLLINKTDIAAVIEDLPPGLLEKRLNPYIRIVQETQLPRILTEAVYLAFIAAFNQADATNPMPSQWQALYDLRGFRHMMAYLSWAEYLPFSQATVTSNSVVTKLVEGSDPVDAKLIGIMINNTRNTASHYVRLVQAFLNSGNYSEYRTTCSDTPRMPGLSTIIAL